MAAEAKNDVGEPMGSFIVDEDTPGVKGSLLCSFARFDDEDEDDVASCEGYTDEDAPPEL
jgi:hypothetical protein